MGMFKSGLKTHFSKYDGSALDSDYYMRVGEVDFLQIRCQSACTHIHICQMFNVRHNASSFQDEPVHRRSLMPCTVCQRGTLGRKRPLHLGWHEAFYGSKLIAFVASLAASSMLIVSQWLSNMFKSHQWSWPTVARSKYIQGPRPWYCMLLYDIVRTWFSLKWQENTKM